MVAAHPAPHPGHVQYPEQGRPGGVPREEGVVGSEGPALAAQGGEGKDGPAPAAAHVRHTGHQPRRGRRASHGRHFETRNI